ncbi:mucin-2-like [Chaetodon trifascialis]|uniref:mucin-2-like n=1 Tax=Chaetodon trifascialis TaxID=109706 RepID=UPI003991C0A1
MRWRCVWLCVLAASVVDVQARLVQSHVSSICSTWGREHFKTFDGDVYQFPGMCEYNFASDCHNSYQEFSVHMKRKEDEESPTVSYVAVTINDISFHLTKSLVTVNGLPVKLPYYSAGVQVEKNVVYIKLQSKVGIVVMWNGDDALMVELDHDYVNRTCGLCGDFSGAPIYNEFIHNGRKISPIEFGNKQKVHHPNDDCEDPDEEEAESLDTVLDSCKEFQTTCNQMLLSESWSSCTTLINPEPYVQACMQDMCGCSNSTSDFCVCSTVAEFSRQCSHAGGQPPNWRTPQFCAKQCPFSMIYEESGSPCMDTCTHQDTSSLCEEHKMDGCFCPPGTVFDDISMRGCIAQSECQCKHNKIYNSSEVYRQDREECTCLEGKWVCQSLQTPATCALEEGSHVTTFDGKTYTFHGECHYTLAKVESTDDDSPKFTILVQLVPCSNQKFDTCLKSLKIMLNNDRNNVLMFTSEGTVKQNMQTITLPYHSGDINIFRPSSFHILLQTTFGLQIHVQHVPVMQVYVSLQPSYRAKTRGLCGNYNMVLSDDMKTPQGIVEGTAASFCNSWKANIMCPDREERLDDPCSLSVENEWYAKHWCALLQSPNSTFAQCHLVVDPEMYYKRCIYASCNCDKSEACLCAVFSSYARACASKGVLLTDWRDDVCNKYTKSCPASQTFSYKHQRCQPTCRSLSSKQQSCTSLFLPVDGCSCSDGLYLNENDICVPMAKCSCYHKEGYIKPGKSVNIKDEHCVCTNGMLHCHSWRARSSTCPHPKVFFNCSTAGTGELGLQCVRTCLNMDSVDCDSTDCESGCQCPFGLLDDGRGSCVKEHQCPCQHDGQLYPPGAKIPNQCNNCTCNSGRWECTDKNCAGTCVIYGSGHYSTFDQQTYGFQGHCAYVAVKNKCGNKTVENNFGVITENVPCGSTGTTCSKTVRIQLGRIEIKLSKGKYEKLDLGNGTQIQYKIWKAGSYLVIESAIGLAVMWDRKTTVRILLEPQHSGEVCGLCGNFDGDGQNDFTTQGQLTVSNSLEFANSWKVSSSCADVEMNVDPCVVTPNRHHWAKIMCSIITGDTFKYCRNTVDHRPFYDNCVKDSCACDSGGDCECFCTAVAAYAQACNEAGVCVAWRTPEICPIFCDYYNSRNECMWHYNPCHTPCYRTCLNPEPICSNPIPNLEGCYPVCPEDKPIFDEITQMCVEKCPGPPTTTAGSNHNDKIYNPINGISHYNCRSNHDHKIYNPDNRISYYNCRSNHNNKIYNPINGISNYNCRSNHNHKIYNPTNRIAYYNCRSNHNYKIYNPINRISNYNCRSNHNNKIYNPINRISNYNCRSNHNHKIYNPTNRISYYNCRSNHNNKIYNPINRISNYNCRSNHNHKIYNPTNRISYYNCRSNHDHKIYNPDNRISFYYNCRSNHNHKIYNPTNRIAYYNCRSNHNNKIYNPINRISNYNCPTTTTKSTTPPTESPITTERSTTITTTERPTTTTKSTTPSTELPTTTAGPTTTTKSTTPPTGSPTTTAGPTTTTKSTTPSTEFPTTTAGPTTTTKSTTPPTESPTTTAGPTTTTKSTTPPTGSPTTTAGPTTTTKSTTPSTEFPTTTANHNYKIYNPINRTSHYNCRSNHNHKIYNPTNRIAYYNCRSNHNNKIYNPINRISNYNCRSNHNHKIYNPTNRIAYYNCRSNHNHKIYNPINRISNYNCRSNHDHKIYNPDNRISFYYNCPTTTTKSTTPPTGSPTTTAGPTTTTKSTTPSTEFPTTTAGPTTTTKSTTPPTESPTTTAEANHNYKIYNPINRTSHYNCRSNHNHKIYNPTNRIAYYNCRSNHNHKIYNPTNRIAYYNCRSNHNYKIYNPINRISNYNCRSNHNHKIYNPINRISNYNCRSNHNHKIYNPTNRIAYYNCRSNHNYKIYNPINGISNYNCRSNHNHKIYNPTNRIAYYNCRSNHNYKIYNPINGISNYNCRSNHNHKIYNPTNRISYYNCRSNHDHKIYNPANRISYYNCRSNHNNKIFNPINGISHYNCRSNHNNKIYNPINGISNYNCRSNHNNKIYNPINGISHYKCRSKHNNKIYNPINGISNYNCRSNHDHKIYNPDNRISYYNCRSKHNNKIYNSTNQISHYNCRSNHNNKIYNPINGISNYNCRSNHNNKIYNPTN